MTSLLPRIERDEPLVVLVNRETRDLYLWLIQFICLRFNRVSKSIQEHNKTLLGPFPNNEFRAIRPHEEYACNYGGSITDNNVSCLQGWQSHRPMLAFISLAPPVVA